ncbi:hypothetical protein PINS_up006447 [Pythium insidiosum]|nr:hypothetical protein PINS_up006447 [Pythium insidiosum]
MESVVEGDRVLYRETSEQDWRPGIVKAVRSDGAVDVVDRATKEVVRKVPREHVKRRRPPPTDKSKTADKDDDESTAKADGKGTASWAEGDHVEYATADGEWCRGRIVRRRRDGAAFDVAHESDEEHVEKSVPLKRLRRARQTSSTAKEKTTLSDKEAPREEEDEEEEEEKSRKSKKTKKEGKKKKDDDDEDDANEDEADESGSSSGGARRRTRRRSLQPQQRVEFSDSKQRVHRGRVLRLRDDGASCDIEHESDSERVSKRVPVADVRPLGKPSTASKRTTRSTTANSTSSSDPNAVFALNARVYYRLKDDSERRGFVVKVWPREDGDAARFYDIEDEIEGDVVRRVAASRLRPVSWLPSLPALPLPALPSLPTLPSLGVSAWSSSLLLRPGAAVRVRVPAETVERRKRAKNSEKAPVPSVWVDGVVVRLKAKGMCVVRLLAGDSKDEEVVVPRRDVRTSLLPSFGPLLPSSLHLQLPTSLLPTPALFPVHSAVEVVDPRRDHQVFLGTVVATQDAERTYTIRYDDGRKEKHVAAERVRLSLRRLRIGTEVEMIVEGPCKEVSKLDAEVAWVHRDEKVAVRLLGGGHNDVFAEVSTHALMVNGQPAFSAPLGSTWLELLGVYLNLSLELLAFLWLAFGLLVELSEMLRVLRQTAPSVLRQDVLAAQHCNRTATVGSGAEEKDPMAIERAWLVVFLVLKLLLLLACVSFAYRLVHSRILALQDKYVDHPIRIVCTAILIPCGLIPCRCVWAGPIALSTSPSTSRTACCGATLRASWARHSSCAT